MNTFKQKQIIDFIKNFTERYSRPPTGSEIEAQGILSKRQIQRSYGGLVHLRTLAGVEPDLRKTEYRSLQAKKINKRAALLETRFYKKLIAIFGERSVNREFSFIDDTRHRTDFMVYTHPTDDSKKILIDVFYPGDRASLGGCVGAKRRKYESHISDDRELVDAMYFVNLNPKLDADNYPFKADMPWAKVLNEETFWKKLQIVV